jgi:translation initiation factor 3 subunit D
VLNVFVSSLTVLCTSFFCFYVQFEPNPFFNEDEDSLEPASVAYRYRLFQLGDIKLVVRCEISSWMSRAGEEKFINLYALNEWDSRLSGSAAWRQKLDTQRTAVIATELKNNSAKVAKWTAQAILSGAEQMKIGFVSRVLSTDPSQHVLLGTQLIKPTDLAQQTNLSIPNLWGIVKMLCTEFLKKEDGKYVIFKDPNRSVMKIFSVPMETFEAEEEDDEDDDDEGNEGEAEN